MKQFLNRLEQVAERMRPRMYLWLALIVMAPRVVFVAVNPQRSIYGNAPSLLVVADNLAAGRGCIGEGGTPDSYFNPGYPLFLAAFRWISPTNLLSIKLAQVALDVGTALLLCWVFSNVCSTLTVLLIGIAVALHPLLLHFGNNINDEPLLMFLIVGSFAMLVRAVYHPIDWRFGLAGASLGLAILTKSTPIFLPYLATGVLWLVTRRAGVQLRHWLVYLAASIIVMLPWACRNHAVFGHFSVNVRGIGTNLWWGSDPRIFTSYGKAQRSAATQIQAEMTAKGVQPAPTNNAFDREQWGLRMAIQGYKDLLHHPAALVHVLALKFTRTLYATEDRPSAHLPLLLLQLPTLALAVFGIIRLGKRRDTAPLSWLLVVYVGYYYLVVSVGMPMIRYFMPVIPLLLAAAAVGLVDLLSPTTKPARSGPH